MRGEEILIFKQKFAVFMRIDPGFCKYFAKVEICFSASPSSCYYVFKGRFVA